MNCLEAQSKIMAFIENKLPDDELREFIKHVRSCKNCYEELQLDFLHGSDKLVCLVIIDGLLLK